MLKQKTDQSKKTTPNNDTSELPSASNLSELRPVTVDDLLKEYAADVRREASKEYPAAPEKLGRIVEQGKKGTAGK